MTDYEIKKVMQDMQDMREIIAQEIERMIIVATSYDNQQLVRFIQKGIAQRVRRGD